MKLVQLTTTQLSERIFEFIQESGSVTDDQIFARGQSKGLTVNAIELALHRLHKHPQVKTQQKQSDEGVFLVYSIKELRIKKADPTSHITWINQNYPYKEPCGAPGCKEWCDQCMPFPEIDMSYLFMTRDEAKAFRIEQKGGFAAHNRNRYAKKSSN